MLINVNKMYIKDLLFSGRFDFMYIYLNTLNSIIGINLVEETYPIEIPLARRVRISNYTKYRQTVRQFRASIEIYSIILTSIKYSIELKKFHNGFLILNSSLILSRISIIVDWILIKCKIKYLERIIKIKKKMVIIQKILITNIFSIKLNFWYYKYIYIL